MGGEGLEPELEYSRFDGSIASAAPAQQLDDAQLAAIAEAWAQLPETVRAEIAALASGE